MSNNHENNRTYIIAEIGVNHDGSMKKAKELIEGAKHAGADAVKFQSFVAKDLANLSTPKVPYQLKGDNSPTHQSMLEKLELTHSQQQELFAFSSRLEIDFMSTPYSKKEMLFLNELGVKSFKVASADIVDIPLHELAAKLGKHTFVSTGMASRAEIDEVIGIYKRSNTPMTLLHCTSEYPTPSHHASMDRMKTLREMSNSKVGFSDHTTGNLAAIMAIAIGCAVIEKHITMCKTDPGPDHAASFDIEEFTKYCQLIRESESAIGTDKFLRTKDEELMALTSRKSLHLARDIKTGEIVNEDDFLLMRPGTGLYWSQKHTIIGKQALVDLKQLQLVRLEDFN